MRSSLDPAVTAAVWRFFFLGRKLRVFSCWPAQSSLVYWPSQSHSFSWFFWFAAAVWQDFSEKLRYFSCWLAQFILVCSAVQFSVSFSGFQFDEKAERFQLLTVSVQLPVSSFSWFFESKRRSKMDQSSQSQIKVSLEESQLWEKFAVLTNEMIVTKVIY
mgnify:CR=1 FL=1